jgi:CTP synthase
MSAYLFITGGVCSSLGKGVAAASVGSLLESAGLRVALVKCDPYINVDSGNISPYQYGEVYVTGDGAETHLDLGTFARFTQAVPTRDCSITAGQVYRAVIQNEREGRYNGRAVQVIPHITDEIKRRVLNAGMCSGADAVLVAIGGTVGDIESIPFLEAARQLIRERGRAAALSMHLTLVPALAGGEMKTKPTQHAVKKMQENGIQPDILLCRSEAPLSEELRRKIALFCNVEAKAVFASPDVRRTVYELPVLFHEQGLDAEILRRLGFADRRADVSAWQDFLSRLDSPKARVCIGLVGRKNNLDDCYKSVREALLHAAVSAHGADLSVRRIDAESLEKEGDAYAVFAGVDGIILPGMHGQRGFLGLLAAVRYAREQRIPYLGIDLGMQLMAIEAARNLLGWEEADSTEFVRNTAYPVVSLPEEQAELSAAGMLRLGAEPVALEKGSLLERAYRTDTVAERHRNKYAFDRRYAADIESGGLRLSAFSPGGQTEAFEWARHPWGIGVQYHPEFASRPSQPHPLFAAFIGAALGKAP